MALGSKHEVVAPNLWSINSLALRSCLYRGYVMEKDRQELSVDLFAPSRAMARNV